MEIPDHWTGLRAKSVTPLLGYLGRLQCLDVGPQAAYQHVDFKNLTPNYPRIGWGRKISPSQTCAHFLNTVISNEAS